jgi:hypothetical protein
MQVNIRMQQILVCNSTMPAGTTFPWDASPKQLDHHGRWEFRRMGSLCLHPKYSTANNKSHFWGCFYSNNNFVLYFLKDKTRCFMVINTYEGVVEKGKIRLKAGVKLPENAKVYVIVTDLEMEKKKPIRVLTPRLARRGQATQFKMQVSREKPNA